MTSNKYEAKYKELLRVERELNKLWKIKWSTEPLKLDKPIPHGYIRFLRMRPDNVTRGDYQAIKDAFEYIGQSKAFSKNKNFLIKHKNHIQEKHAQLRWKADPRFKFFNSESQREREYEHIEKCKIHLKHVTSMIECNCSASHCKPNQFLPHYEFKKPWLLEEKTEVNLLTHYTPIDGNIESQIAELNKIMYDENGWQLLHGRQWEPGWDDTFGPLKVEIHAYLHGYPRPRIDELYD
jgi:hypothetical protein